MAAREDGGKAGLAARVEALERRVGALEDELAVHRLIVTYGFAVDTGDADATGELFTADTLYDVDTTLVMEGRDGVRDMVRGPRHQALLPNCAHTIGPAVVEVDGDRAVATAYSRIYLREDTLEGLSGARRAARPARRTGRGGIALWRLSFNRFELVRRDGRWRISRRTTRLLGHEEAQDLLRRAFPGR